MSEIIFIPTTLVQFLVDAENTELMIKENTGVSLNNEANTSSQYVAINNGFGGAGKKEEDHDR